MINILQTQFFRLKKSSLFWALFGVCAGLPLLGMLFIVMIVSLSNAFIDEVNLWEAIRSGYSIASSFSGYADLTNLPSILALICSSVFLSREFSNGTVRNVILANKSRKALYLSYLSVAMIVGVSYFGVSFVATLIFEAPVLGFGQMTAGQAISSCVTSFALGLVSVAFVQTMICMFLFCTRKLAPTLACTLVICLFASGIISTLVVVVTTVKTIVNGLEYQVNVNALGWIPLYNMTLYDAANIDGALVGKIMLYNIPLSALWGWLGWLSIKKADLK